MFRTAPLCLLVVALLALAAAAPAVAAPAWQAADRVPHALPPTGPHAAAGVSAPGWLIGARASQATARLARAHGARALRLQGSYAVPAGRARAFASALRHRGLLTWSAPDRVLARQSAFEGNGGEAMWARGSVVAPGLAPPADVAPIGIVDDAVDTSVPDVAQAKVLAKSASKTVSDAHGTEVASVAAGQANGAGVIGITPGAPIISYGFKDLTCSEAVNGTLDVVDAGAGVVNLSFATDDDSCFALQLATAEAFAQGALVVAASGNEFRSGNPVVYPAAYPHVLSVGALDLGLEPAYFSSTGAGLDLAAPGQSVPVAVPPRFDLDGNPDGVTRASGTSFAAPIVSGVASWLIGARPGLGAGQYADLLRASAKDIGEPGWDRSTGFGLVDLAAALQAPTPPVDRYEPNDGITFVDGTAFSKPDPYVWTGAAARTLQASVDAVEDPADVYRIRLPARRRATLTLAPGAGDADLRVYGPGAKSLSTKPLTKSARGVGQTETVHVTNGGRRARTYYVAVVAPSITARSFSAQYTLKLRRG